MNYILIISFGLMSSVNCNIWPELDEFCEIFRRNNHRISFTYFYDPVIKSNRDWRFIEVIINEKHWTLMTTNKIEFLKFLDPNHESQTPLDIFKGDYQISMRACPSSFKYDDCSVLLINTHSWKASILEKSSSRDDMRPENLKKKVKEVKLKDMFGQPFAAFQTDAFDKRFFVEHDRNSGQLDFKGYDLFSLDVEEITPIEQKWSPIWKLSFLKSKIGSINLLSLMFAYKEKDDFGFILLWEKNAVLWWCWNHADQTLSQDCKNGHLLVNCSSMETSSVSTLPKTVPKTNGIDSSLVLIVIIVVIIVVIILLIIGVVVYLKS